MDTVENKHKTIVIVAIPQCNKKYHKIKKKIKVIILW